MSRFVLLISVIFLAGCLVGPDYQRPDVDVPQDFRYQKAEALDTANTAWWNEFQDPVLGTLVEEALANNLTIKIAAANIEQAAAMFTQVRSQAFPQVNYSGEAGRERISGVDGTIISRFIDNPRDSYQLLAGANWELDFWGRIRRLSEAARAQLLASREARRGVILSLVASVAKTYIQLRGLDAQLEIARKTVSTYAESVKLFELQFKHGQVSQMTVAQAKSQYQTAVAAIPQIEAQIARLENTLSTLLGRNPGAIARGQSIQDLVPPPVPAGLPSQLLERRPDLVQAEQNLIAANAQIGAAKALYFPTISLTGALGTKSTQLSDLFTEPTHLWSYAGSITGPIFNAGAITGQVRQAEAKQQAALLTYQNAILAAFSDVENALVSQQKLSQQVEDQKELVASLKEYVRLAWLQYNGGYTPYLTVLNAESQLFPAELNYAEARMEQIMAYVDLYQAMGGGWVKMAEKKTEKETTAEMDPPSPRPEYISN